MIHLFISFLFSLTLSGCNGVQQNDTPTVDSGYLYKVEPGIPGKSVYVCGQRPFNASGALVGGDNLSLQTKQVFENLKQSLKTVNMSLSDVTQVTYFVKGTSTTASAVDADKAQVITTQATNYFPVAPSIIEMKNVAQTARDNVLVEIEVVAVK